MTKTISDVDVGKVTLVTDEHNPAVPKASKKFAIFKFFQKNKISKTAIKKLEDIQRKMKLDDIRV